MVETCVDTLMKKGLANVANPLISLARPQGLEPRTYGLEVRCSILLSYGRWTRGKYNSSPFSVQPDVSSLDPLRAFVPLV